MRNEDGRHRVAIVVAHLAGGGGVPAVAGFLCQAIDRSDRYAAELISVATSSQDPQSSRLLSPASWVRGVCAAEGSWRGRRYRHYGAPLVEFEFMRYLPRRALTEHLGQYAIIQVVAGSPAWAMIAGRVRRPVVLQVATLFGVERATLLSGRGGLTGVWRRWMTRACTLIEDEALRHVDTVLVENNWMLEHLRGQGCRRVVFAPPGVDTDLFRPAPAGAAGEGFILSVARFGDPRKNVRLLFEAYAQLRQERPGVPRLVLAGKSGPTPADWAHAAALGVADHIEVRQDVPARELAELYRTASLFVLSSNEEGLGIVLLEAMASGLPVVSTRCGGPETVVTEGQTGFLVPVGDAPALAARIGTLLDSDAMRRAMGVAGRRVVVERFSLDAAARPFLETYDELLAGAGDLCVASGGV